MVRRYGLLMVLLVVAFVAGSLTNEATTVQAQSNQIYELRTYTTAEGRLPALLQRFGGGETELFHKHGMTGVGYWVPDDAPASENTMIYMLAHDSRDAAAASWQGFFDDPEWTVMREASLADGPIVTEVESTFMNPTDFSPAR